MKVQYSLPKDEKFFGDYASLAPTLVALGYLAQVVNALTEFGVVYSIVKASLQDFFPNYAPAVGLFGAIIGTAFLEVGLRKFIPYSVRAILYKRFAGLHLFISCFVFVLFCRSHSSVVVLLNP
jgi:H+/gluconate symporter-like permease